MLRRLTFPAISWLLCATTSAAFGQASFQGLNDLTGGLFESGADGVGGRGRVIAGRGHSSLGREALLWRAGTRMTGLGDLPGGEFESRAFDVSADGLVAVGKSKSALGNEAFRWDPFDGMQGLGDLPGGIFRSEAHGVSADGRVVVGLGTSISGVEAIRWDAANGMLGLGDLPGGDFESVAADVSADGRVIVGWGNSTEGREAFVWTAEDGLLGLGDLPGGPYYSLAHGISADGNVIVGRSISDSALEAVRWDTDGRMSVLEPVPAGAFDSKANAVSTDGTVIVGHFHFNTPIGVEHTAFIWDATHGMRRIDDVLRHEHKLDLEGWSLIDALDVSPDGEVIVGFGTNPDGHTEAWRAVIPRSRCPVRNVVEKVLAAAPPSRLDDRRSIPFSHQPEGTESAIALGIVRAFRDRVLIRSRAGARFVSMYYRHAAELNRILSEHPALAIRAGWQVLHSMPALRDARSSQGRVRFTIIRFSDCRQLLDDVRTHAGAELRESIDLVNRFLDHNTTWLQGDVVVNFGNPDSKSITTVKHSEHLRPGE